MQRNPDDYFKRDTKDGEKIRGRFRLRRLSRFRQKLLFYFLLVMFVSLTVGVELIFEIGSPKLSKQIAMQVGEYVVDTDAHAAIVAQITGILNHLQHRMILVMAVVFALLVLTLFIFIRNIVAPLDEIAQYADRIAAGHLNETVPVQSRDEIGKIGELINELAVNLQEILLHIWNHTKQDLQLLDKIRKVTESEVNPTIFPELEKDIECVRSDIQEMREMVKLFDFYHVRLERGMVFSNSPPQMDEKNEGGASHV